MGLQCAGEVVGVGAAEAVAAARGSGLLTVSAAQSQTSSESQFHIDQSAGLSFIHLTGPQSTVQVDLRHSDRQVNNWSSAADYHKALCWLLLVQTTI